MKPANPARWSTQRLAVLSLLAVVAMPCRADEAQGTGLDTEAYQLIQLLNQNEALSSELARLRGQIEVLLESAKRDRESRDRIATDFDTRIANLEAKPQTDTSADKARIAELETRIQQLEQAITAMHDIVTSSVKTPPQMSAAETVYEAAVEKYRAGDYEAAVVAFDAFLQLYQDNPLAANARYWLAEALLRQGAYERAIKTGEQLLFGQPDNRKAPDTMFLLGKAHLELGDAAGARRAWETLLATYPLSDPANKARLLLDQLP